MKAWHEWQVTTHTPEDTERLGANVGARLRGGEVVELVSDLGGGKTTFVRGLAKGAGSRDHVTSPSFTIGQEYTAGDLVLYHFDFYRLQEAGVMEDELAEAAGDPHGAVIVEWGNIVRHVLPEGSLIIEIQATGETERKITFTYLEDRAYLVPKEV